jgi:predicted TIM-barrel fold metal-dependent hydrolase
VIDAVLNVNLKGVFFATQAFVQQCQPVCDPSGDDDTLDRPCDSCRTTGMLSGRKSLMARPPGTLHPHTNYVAVRLACKIGVRHTQSTSHMQALSRRRLLATAAACAGGVVAPLRVLLGAKAAQPSTKIAFPVPPGACDCHVHIFGDPQRYAFFTGRTYTPEPASVAELRGCLDALHMDRVVIVQPSVYGTDNRCTVDAVRELGRRARGVAVINADTTERALDEMAAAGVRGLRLNLMQAGVSDPAAAIAAFTAAAARARPRNWHIQLNTSLRVIEAMQPQLQASPVPIVFDHFGGANASSGVQQPGFAALVALVKSGTAYVKISGAADSVSKRAPDYPDVVPLARALVGANPQRILWGTNWPHPDSAPAPGRKNTDIAPLVQTDDGRVLNLLKEWVPDETTRRAILVDNPVRLYGF